MKLNIFLCIFLCAAGLAAEDKILAEVNGEAIHESEVRAGIPPDIFGPSLEDAVNFKLERLINSRILHRFLESKHITVPKKEIDDAIAKLEKTPPAAACACCRYPDLAAYLKANLFDMKEFRETVADNIGCDKYLESEWEKAYPTGPKRNELVKEKRSGIEKDYMKVSHIFLNSYMNMNPDPAKRNSAEKKAAAAWEKLKNGESFGKVSSEFSDDAVSKKADGLIGYIPRDTFGAAFKDAFKDLKPGEYSKPVETVWGFHIIRRESVTDEDILLVLKSDYMNDKWESIQSELMQNAKIERHNQ